MKGWRTIQGHLRAIKRALWPWRAGGGTARGGLDTPPVPAGPPLSEAEKVLGWLANHVDQDVLLYTPGTWDVLDGLIDAGLAWRGLDCSVQITPKGRAYLHRLQEGRTP